MQDVLDFVKAMRAAPSRVSPSAPIRTYYRDIFAGLGKTPAQSAALHCILGCWGSSCSSYLIRARCEHEQNIDSPILKTLDVLARWMSIRNLQRLRTCQRIAMASLQQCVCVLSDNILRLAVRDATSAMRSLSCCQIGVSLG
eukprot:5022005-Amphidinium_carterae.1